MWGAPDRPVRMTCPPGELSAALPTSRRPQSTLAATRTKPTSAAQIRRAPSKSESSSHQKPADRYDLEESPPGSGERHGHVEPDRPDRRVIAYAPPTPTRSVPVNGLLVSPTWPASMNTAPKLRIDAATLDSCGVDRCSADRLRVLELRSDRLVLVAAHRGAAPAVEALIGWQRERRGALRADQPARARTLPVRSTRRRDRCTWKRSPG